MKSMVESESSVGPCSILQGKRMIETQHGDLEVRRRTGANYKAASSAMSSNSEWTGLKTSPVALQGSCTAIWRIKGRALRNTGLESHMYMYEYISICRERWELDRLRVWLPTVLCIDNVPFEFYIHVLIRCRVYALDATRIGCVASPCRQAHAWRWLANSKGQVNRDRLVPTSTKFVSIYLAPERRYQQLLPHHQLIACGCPLYFPVDEPCKRVIVWLSVNPVISLGVSHWFEVHGTNAQLATLNFPRILRCT